MVRKISFLTFSCFLLFTAIGCSTKTYYLPTEGEAEVPETATFAVGETQDLTGFVSDDPKETFSLSSAMDEALKKELSKAGALNNDSEYILVTQINEYAPGNAGLRWLLPGAGATKLDVKTFVKNKNGHQMASIPVSRSIAAGGGFTIGAWEYVFEDVAKEIVSVLRDSGKRKSPPTEKTK